MVIRYVKENLREFSQDVWFIVITIEYSDRNVSIVLIYIAQQGHPFVSRAFICMVSVCYVTMNCHDRTA